MAVDNATILDKVRLRGTDDYQQRVPSATHGFSTVIRALLSWLGLADTLKATGQTLFSSGRTLTR